MKFYDKGFILKYKNYTQVQIFSTGIIVLNLKIYKNKICKDTFKCQDLKSFNKQYLHKSYSSNFIKKLFEQDKNYIVHRDKKNKILIKINKD